MYAPSLLLRLVAVLTLTFLATESAWGKAPAELGARPADRIEVDRSTALALQLDTLLEARTNAAGNIADVDDRRTALLDIKAFAVMTADGLVNALPSGSARSDLRESLAAVIDWHSREIDAAIAGPSGGPASNPYKPNSEAAPAFAAP